MLCIPWRQQNLQRRVSIESRILSISVVASLWQETTSKYNSLAHQLLVVRQLYNI